MNIEGNEVFSKCEVFTRMNDSTATCGLEDFEKNTTKHCSEWVFDNKYGITSTVTEVIETNNPKL